MKHPYAYCIGVCDWSDCANADVTIVSSAAAGGQRYAGGYLHRRFGIPDTGARCRSSSLASGHACGSSGSLGNGLYLSVLFII